MFFMKNSKSFWLKAGAALVAACFVFSVQAADKKILVVSVTKGFVHDVIPDVNDMVAKLAKDSGQFDVTFVKTDEDMAKYMTMESLQKYDGVFFNNTTGDLPLPDRQGFINWIASGKGYVGVHSATDTFGGFPPYTEMVGGLFLTHRNQATVSPIIEDPNHPILEGFPKDLKVHDEIYLLQKFHRETIHGLLTLDKRPNDGSEDANQPGDYTIAYCKNWGQGRVFYTSLGHRKDVVATDWYQRHVLQGIQWSLGLIDGDPSPTSKWLKLSDEEVAEGFVPLFNGCDLTGWHYRRADGYKSWSAQNGMLVNRIPKNGHGTDLVTNKKYRDFIVRYEYMVPEGSNSGFYLRGRHEIQVLGEAADAKPEKTGDNAIYNHTAASVKASKKPGEWNTVEAIVKGNKVTVTVNGKKVHDNLTVDRATGSELDGNVNDPGSFFVQGDHGNVAFRNMRVKELK